MSELKKETVFETTINSLIDGMNQFVSSKTVVGEPITVGDTILIPLVDVSFGAGAGAGQNDKKNNAGGGIGGKISPSAVLVIKDGNVRLVNIKNQDAVTKVIDMMPDIIDRVKNPNSPEVKEEVEKIKHSEK